MLRLLVSLSVSQFLGLVLLWAGAQKALDRSGTRQTLESYLLVPSRLVRPLSILLPAAEILIAFLLMGDPRGTRVGLAGATVLFALFGVAQLVNLLSGRVVPCGCFGQAEDRLISARTVLVNFALAAASALALVLMVRTIDPHPSVWIASRAVATVLFVEMVALLRARANTALLDEALAESMSPAPDHA